MPEASPRGRRKAGSTTALPLGLSRMIWSFLINDRCRAGIDNESNQAT